MLKKHNFFTSEKKRIGSYVILIVVTVFHLVFDGASITHGIFKYGLLSCLSCACVGILLMTAGVYAGRLEWRCLDWIKKTGVYTYWIICIHSVEMTCVRWYMLTERFAERQIIAFVIELCVKVLLFTLSILVLKQIAKRKYRRKMKENGK